MTLRVWKLLAVTAPWIFSACATIGPPLPPSLELPKPPSDLRAVRKGEHVILSWSIPTTTTDRQTARSFGATRICRGVGTELTGCPAVGQVDIPASAPDKPSGQKVKASYTDLLGPMESEDPNAVALYAVEVRNAEGRSAGLSNQVRVRLVRTLPPPQDFRARVTNQGVVLSWANGTPHAGPDQKVHYVYRVYRRLEDAPQWILAGETSAGVEHELGLTDSNFEWDKTYLYRVESVTVVAGKAGEEQVEGDDSPEIKVFAHDVFPPGVPSGLQAVFSGPGQKPAIDLIWAPVPDVDLEGYNVYRHEEGSEPLKINTNMVKTPAYRDSNVAAGKHYIYSVSAVDIRGNESAHSEEAGESVP